MLQDLGTLSSLLCPLQINGRFDLNTERTAYEFEERRELTSALFPSFISHNSWETA